MNPAEKQKQILEILKTSLLANAVKEILKKNIKKYPEAILDGIFESLAREKVLAEKLSEEILRFDADSQKRWNDLAKEQITVADAFVEKIAKELTS